MGTVFPHWPILPVVSETQPLTCHYLKAVVPDWEDGKEAREIPVGPLAWGLRPCTGGFILAAASLSDPPSFGLL